MQATESRLISRDAESQFSLWSCSFGKPTDLTVFNDVSTPRKPDTSNLKEVPHLLRLRAGQ